MAKFDAQKWAQYIKKHKNPLIVTGDSSENIELGGKKLLDYATRIAGKLSCPIAATGNTVIPLQKNNGFNVKKMWIAELFRYLQGKWSEPLLEKRPDLLVLIGYRPEILAGMINTVKRVHTVYLGPGKLDAANRSVDEITLKDWKNNLEELISEL